VILTSPYLVCVLKFLEYIYVRKCCDTIGPLTNCAERIDHVLGEHIPGGVLGTRGFNVWFPAGSGVMTPPARRTMTHCKRNTSCLDRYKRFESKIGGAVRSWPRSSATSQHVSSATHDPRASSNSKMWSCTFAWTVACAPSNERAIIANACVDQKATLTSSSWSLRSDD
jgi:hypothetical protein